jgi:glycosyltransferase involved in cell wall biosynthesis
MSLPLVSVIIPTFNRSSLVPEAVDSVFKQTFTDFELIVVDDGSNDDTSEVLTPYKDRLVYCFQKNRGVSGARNLGIQMAQGRWIAFLDSDDLWLPRKLETQTRFVSQNPGALICQTEEIWLRHGRRVNPQKKHQKFSGDVFAPSLRLCIVSPSAVMIRKDLFEQVGFFDEGLPAGEDYDLWLRISARFPIFLINQPLIIKRGGHPDQLSRSTPSLDRFRIQALVKILNSGELTVSQYDLAYKELKTKCQIYGQGCLKRGRTEEGNYYLQLPNLLTRDWPRRWARIKNFGPY